MNDMPINRDRRIALNQAVTLIDSAGRNYPARIVDLSSGGFRVECGQLLRVGEYVVLSGARDEAMRGQIRWAEGQSAGGIFLSAIDPAIG